MPARRQRLCSVSRCYANTKKPNQPCKLCVSQSTLSCRWHPQNDYLVKLMSSSARTRHHQPLLPREQRNRIRETEGDEERTQQERQAHNQQQEESFLPQTSYSLRPPFGNKEELGLNEYFRNPDLWVKGAIIARVLQTLATKVHEVEFAIVDLRSRNAYNVEYALSTRQRKARDERVNQLPPPSFIHALNLPNHWVMCLGNVADDYMIVLDSSVNMTNNFSDRIRQYYSETFFEERNPTILVVADAPQQTNANDCGLFVLFHILSAALQKNTFWNLNSDLESGEHSYKKIVKRTAAPYWAPETLNRKLLNALLCMFFSEKIVDRELADWSSQLLQNFLTKDLRQGWTLHLQKMF
jgi:hypothetical protein